MNIFQVVVGVFSIISSIAAILSACFLVQIKNNIHIKGNNNDITSVSQSVTGIGNKTSNRIN